ncbi:MAG: hypothetical protein Q4F98_03635 [Lachnospiraceae bacterium]|nr:hypothetical protein [Lachnospiraceae bacterium]
MTSRKELFDSLKTGMHLNKNFFLRVYGYNMDKPGFSDDVIEKMQALGCSRAREYYCTVVTEFERKHEQEIKNVAEWYRKQDFKKRGVRESRNQQVEQSKRKLQTSTERLQLLRKKRELLAQQLATIKNR